MHFRHSLSSISIPVLQILAHCPGLNDRLLIAGTHTHLEVPVNNVSLVHVRDGRAQLLDVHRGPLDSAADLGRDGVEEVPSPDVLLLNQKPIESRRV